MDIDIDICRNSWVVVWLIYNGYFKALGNRRGPIEA